MGLPDHSIIPAFRRSKNLKDIFGAFQAPIALMYTKEVPHLAVSNAILNVTLYVAIITESSSFTSFITGKTYQIKELLSCESCGGKSYYLVKLVVVKFLNVCQKAR